MARDNFVRLSDEELSALETARDRIYGTGDVAIGKVVDSLCGNGGASSEELLDADESGVNLTEDRVVTDTVVGTWNANYDGRRRGVYPEGLNPQDFVGMIRRFVGKNIQYLQVVGDLNGHAVYRMINEGDTVKLHAKPWDEFIDETARVNPDAPGTPDDDPARTVVRQDFDQLRERRNQEVLTGCTCLPDGGEACEQCGGK